MRVYTAAELLKARALTVCQPYSHLIALGLKPLENRDHDRFRWYQGKPLFIHAGKSRAWLDDDDLATYPNMPFGAIESVAWCVGTQHVNQLAESLASNEHAHGPFCMVLEDVWRLPRPVPCSGAQGIWTPPVWVLPFILEQLEAAPCP